MRVLVNAVCRGGIGRYGLLLGQALARRTDASVRVLVSDEVASSTLFGPLCREIDAVPFGLNGKADKLRTLLRIRREVAGFDPDLVHVTCGCAGPLAPWAWLSLPAGPALVVTEHDVVPHSMMGQTSLKRFARREVRRRPVGVIVHGEASRRQFLAGSAPRRNGAEVA